MTPGNSGPGLSPHCKAERSPLAWAAGPGTCPLPWIKVWGGTTVPIRSPGACRPLQPARPSLLSFPYLGKPRCSLDRVHTLPPSLEVCCVLLGAGPCLYPQNAPPNGHLYLQRSLSKCQRCVGHTFKPHEGLVIHCLQQSTETGAIVMCLRAADAHAQDSVIQPSPELHASITSPPRGSWGFEGACRTAGGGLRAQPRCPEQPQ